MARLRRIFIYFLLATGAILLMLTVSVFVFKDQIVNQFIREANKNLNTKVKIGDVHVSWWEAFPNLSIVFQDVYIEDSHPEMYPLLTAARISFQLDVSELLREKYIVHGLQIQDSETQLKINEQGINNYTILQSSSTPSNGGGISFALKNVTLKNTLFRYHDRKALEEYVLNSEQLLASIQTDNNQYSIEARGHIHTDKIKVRDIELFVGKSFSLDSKLMYDDNEKKIVIQPSRLDLRSSRFIVEGEYQWKERNVINLTTTGEDTDIQTLLSLMPENVAQRFAQYRSKGDMYFDAHMEGEISAKTSPALSVKFGFQKATLYHPEYRSRIENANMEGSFASSQVADPKQAVLVLKNIDGTLNGRPFFANLVVQNFSDSDVQMVFKGELDATSVFDFYPVEHIREVKGDLIADLAFEGRLSWLKSRATAKKTSTRGSVELKNLSLEYGSDKVPIRDINGILQFNNNDLALSDVRARLGNSDFLLNGFFKNVVTFLLFEGQPIGIETDLKSTYLDLDELLALGYGKTTEGKPGEYEFNLTGNINMNFNCYVDAMKYRRFRARNVTGDLLVKNQMAVSRNITLNTMGGALNLSAIVDAKNPKRVDVTSRLNLNGIHLDSVFYVFENFDQSFIQDKHLKGQGDAEVDLEMVMSPALKLYSETLLADIGIVIKNGELNDFEPLQKLDKYLDDRGLNRVRFLDLKNDIHIENKKIYLPQMDVQTNVTSIRISGTHTFDQQIDYRLVAPLRSYRKINLGEAGPALENTGDGQSKLYLKIAGTTDNYRIVYDAESVRKKISKDLKQEVTELKEAFQNKGAKKEKALELEEDDYFDWDE